MPAAIPIIGLGISAYSAYRNAQSAKKAQQAQGAALGEQTAGLQAARGMGTQMYGLGMPALSNATNYYQTLLRGNRAQMSQATAGTTAQITDIYRGAERGIGRGMARGPERTMAIENLARDRAAALAGVTTGVQGGAADALARIGGGASELGIRSQLGAAGGFGGQASIYGDNYRYAAGNQREDMKGVGTALAELIKIWSGREQKSPN